MGVTKILDPDKQDEIQRLYDITIDLLENATEDYENAKEAYGDAAVRVTALTEIANTLRNILDS